MNKKIKREFDLEFKQSSAKLAIESDRPIIETAKALGINESTLHGWIKKYGKNIKKTTPNSSIEKLEQENAQLRKENSRLKQERDILKKATAYFASEIA
jgi:transposase